MTSSTTSSPQSCLSRMSTTLLISTFSPFSSIVLSLPSETRIADVTSYLPDYLPSFEDTDLFLSLPSGVLPSLETTIEELLDRSSDLDDQIPEGKFEELASTSRLVSLRLTPRLRGGKGGFGSQLRAAGGRMSSQRTSNTDSCRDLNGRRISTIKEAKALAQYLEDEPARKKAAQEAQKAKLEALERKLGITAGEKGKEKETAEPSGPKRRFDDTEFIEQSREIVDNVRSAVSVGLLKKRKKNNKSSSPEGEASTAGPSKTPETKEAEKSAVADTVEKVSESPMTAPVAATVSSLAAIGA